MTADGRKAEVQAVFERAVQREREAIETHEKAARHLDELAADIERQARLDREERLRDGAHQVAARARERADAARHRAEAARRRLREEGIEP